MTLDSKSTMLSTGEDNSATLQSSVVSKWPFKSVSFLTIEPARKSRCTRLEERPGRV